MIPYVLEVSLCSIGFISFYYLALRNKTFHQCNRFFLLGSLVISFLIPQLNIPIQEIVFVPQIINPSSQLLSTTASKWTLQDYVIVSYLFGCCVMLFIFLKELIQISQIISFSDKEKFPNYSLAKLDRVFPLCSFFNVILCERDKNISQFELEHELAHIRQKHSYDKVFMEVVKIILWFNPAVYIYRKNIHAVHEFLADESVVKVNDKNLYQEYLISQLIKGQVDLSTVNPFHSLIKSRLHMLNNKQKPAKHIFFLVIPIITCLVFFMSCHKTTKVISLDKDEYSNLTFTEDGNIVYNDTFTVFSERYLEEQLHIVSFEVTPEEYIDLNQNSAKESRRVDFIDEFSVTDFPTELITVYDTMIIYNANTHEEKTIITEQVIPIDEYDLDRGYGRAAGWPEGSYITEVKLDRGRI